MRGSTKQSSRPLPALRRPIPPVSDRQNNTLFRRGYSTTEMVFALTIMVLIITAMMSLYVFMMRTAAEIISVSTTSLDAANAIQRIEMSLREARHFQLLDNSTYDATDSGGNVVVTGLRVYAPATGSATSVATSTTGNSASLSGSSANYDRSADGAYLDFYRSDSQGNPAPANGTFLWMRGTDHGSAVNIAVIRSIAPETDAVQFIQPFMSDGTTPIPNDVKISLVTGVNNGIAGTQTSHSTIGAQTMLTGEHVYLRDHDPTGATSAGAHGRTQLAN